MSNTDGKMHARSDDTGLTPGDTMSTKTIPTRGRYALGLRTLMILVLVLGGGLGWAVKRANSRRWAVEAVRKAKGTVLFDYQFANEQRNAVGKPWPPAWLVRLLPQEFFHDVTVVNKLNFSQCEETDAIVATDAIRTFSRLERLRIVDPLPDTTISGFNRLKFLEVSLTGPGANRPIRLGSLAGLREVRLDGPGVNDSVLYDLAGIRSIREMRLQNTSITDAGLTRFEGLADLECLWLDHAHVTDIGLASLVKLKKLVILNLNGNPGVTDEGVRFLSVSLPGLKHLMVGGTMVTDAGLAHLSGFHGLEGLQIPGQGAKITDAGLAHLAGLTHLEVLNLSDSGVTDAGLGSLRGLKKLRWLNLSGTSITDAGLEQLSARVGLEQLYLGRTEVTDAGLKHLYDLKSLKTLEVGGDVSADGIAKLRAASPSLTRVYRVKASVRHPPTAPIN
jgi:internalin A